MTILARMMRNSNLAAYRVRPRLRPVAYRIQVRADSSDAWCGNGRVFQTEESAKQYAVNLAHRWPSVRDYRVVPIFAGEGGVQ